MKTQSYLTDIMKYTIQVGLLFSFSFSTGIASESYYTYLGGAYSETAYAITTDNQDNIYITGHTNSESFNGFEKLNNKVYQDQNCFVVRINPDNAANNYYFEFAGSERESCRAIAVDANQNVYVTGETHSGDLPMTTNQTYSGDWDAFIFKLNDQGKLIYASYVGGSLADYGHGLSLKGIDDVYIIGETWSSDFPTTNNAFIKNCISRNICDGLTANAFVTHIDTRNNRQFLSQYSTYLGGAKNDKAHGISVDKNGLLHIAGETGSSDFPTVNDISNQLKGELDGFVSLIEPKQNGQSSLLFSSYIGGSGIDSVAAITTDANGNSYLTGSSSSDDFPTSQNGFSQDCATGMVKCLTDVTINQHSDIFIAKISMNLFVYSTLLGGTKNESGRAIAVDQQGVVYVAGDTKSADFPLTDNAENNRCNQSNVCGLKSDSFLIKIDTSRDGKNGLLYSSFLGGSNSDNSLGLRVKANKHILLTGETFSPNLSTPQALDNQQESSEAYLQEIEIIGNGAWIENKQTIKPRTKASSLSLPSLYLLAILAIIGIFQRRKHMNKIPLPSSHAIL